MAVTGVTYPSKFKILPSYPNYVHKKFIKHKKLVLLFSDQKFWIVFRKHKSQCDYFPCPYSSLDKLSFISITMLQYRGQWITRTDHMGEFLDIFFLLQYFFSINVIFSFCKIISKSYINSCYLVNVFNIQYVLKELSREKK